MKIQFFDAHTHVQFAAFEKDYAEVIRRALDNGVGMVNVGTQLDTSRRAIELAHEYENIYAVVGLHPIHTSASHHDAKELGGGASAKSFTSRGEALDYEAYKKLGSDPKVVAIGECGLDYFHVEDEETRVKQEEAFIAQIKLAHELQKPLMIHCRNAFPRLITVLQSHKEFLNALPGIIHFFSGTLDDAKRLSELGFYFTFGGVITFARDYDAVIQMIPIDRLLSETDAPYVTPAPYRGKRNEPAYVVEVVKKLAELKNMSVEEMAMQIIQNTEKIFKISLK